MVLCLQPVVVLILDELHQHATGSPRMDEGDEAVNAAARLAVDQLDTVRGEILQLGADVLDGDPDVMERLAVTLEEARHATIRGQGTDQLDLSVAQLEKCNLDLLIRHLRAQVGPHVPDTAVARDGFLYVRHHDGRMIDAQQVHGRSSSSRRSNSAKPASIDDSAP